MMEAKQQAADAALCGWLKHKELDPTNGLYFWKKVRARQAAYTAFVHDPAQSLSFVRCLGMRATRLW